MKQIISIFLCFALAFGFAASASAAGDPNVEGGGGGLGGGTEDNIWYGDSGIRLTIVDTESKMPVTTPIDLIKPPLYVLSWYSSTIVHFGKVSKLNYNAGVPLTPKLGNYTCITPSQVLPKIIATNSGSGNITAIRSYFTDEQVLRGILSYTGFDYDELTTGNYKLVIEPLAAFIYCGAAFVMTATEAALYDQKVNGDLRSKMGPLTHKNLPLAIFLEKADMGYPAWTGSTSQSVSDSDIISSLGIGIVSFKVEAEIIENDANYEYRTNTDVITAITLSNNGSDDVTPDKNCTVEFEILGRTYNKPFICPSRNRQLVWVKWHTPSTPQMVNIRVRGVGFGLSTTITANIVQLKENTPPDPQYGDSNKGFKLASTPNYGSNTTASWSQWIAEWIPPLTEEDIGYWEFHLETYTVSLDVDFKLSPDSRVKTAVQRNGAWEMKSGYGINANCETSVYTSGSPNFNTDFTQAQTEVATFSDFGFATYNRMLEPESRNTSTTWLFKENTNSYYGCKVHFTPLWYPDNTNYVVGLSVFDVWTPAGMLYTTASDYLVINGNVYDDWYIRLTK